MVSNSFQTMMADFRHKICSLKMAFYIIKGIGISREVMENSRGWQRARR